MIYAIGRPCEPVRVYVETDDPMRAADQCGEGDVALPVEERYPWASIASDGLSVLVQAPPIAWTSDEVRAMRTSLLSRSDWTMVPDSPLTEVQREGWRAYRQSLRDLPENQPNASLETVIWPKEPDA